MSKLRKLGLSELDGGEEDVVDATGVLDLEPVGVDRARQEVDDGFNVSEPGNGQLVRLREHFDGIARVLDATRQREVQAASNVNFVGAELNRKLADAAAEVADLLVGAVNDRRHLTHRARELKRLRDRLAEPVDDDEAADELDGCRVKEPKAGSQLSRELAETLLKLN